MVLFSLIVLLQDLDVIAFCFDSVFITDGICKIFVLIFTFVSHGSVVYSNKRVHSILYANFQRIQ